MTATPTTLTASHGVDIDRSSAPEAGKSIRAIFTFFVLTLNGGNGLRTKPFVTFGSILSVTTQRLQGTIRFYRTTRDNTRL